MKQRLKRHTIYIFKTTLLSIAVVVYIGVVTLYNNVESVTYNPFSANITNQNNTSQIIATQPEVAKELAKAKNKQQKPLSSTTIKNGDTKTTLVSEGQISSSDIAKFNSLIGQSSNIGKPMDVKFIDQTGNYANFESPIKNYWQNNLLWTSTEIQQLRELDIVDCSTCNWLGLYQGSYTEDASGKINNAIGWITLNVASVKTNQYLLDYMKLALSHEYGHHYSLYYKWTKAQLPFGTRFPDEYYSSRNLPKETTAADYSKGWSNCDAEIVAEDYSYLFSGYGLHAMAGTYGYPNGSVKNWLTGLTGVVQSEDIIPPSITITSPNQNLTIAGTINLNASVTDNVKVSKVDFYIDDQLQASFNDSPYTFSFNSQNFVNGDHIFKVVASDGKQNADKSVNFKIDNSGSDIQAPTVSFSSPDSSPYQWTSGNLLISINAQDNQSVAKIELYINDTLVAEEKSDQLRRNWQFFQNSGTYTVKAKAYDKANNIGEAQITVIKP